MYQRRETSSRTAAQRGRMSRRPQGSVSAPSSARLRPEARSHRAPVQVTLRWLPGSEPWVEITTAEGRCIRPGNMPVWQLVLWLNGWQ